MTPPPPVSTAGATGSGIRTVPAIAGTGAARKQIARLPVDVVNRIAAGEVVERPAAVVKELGENALDAGASQIRVDLEAGGKQLIRIRDNGHGIPADELELAVAPHATSKLTAASDLLHIASFGFRGEALASIASVSHLTIRSRLRDLTARDDADPDGDAAPEAVDSGFEISVRNGVTEGGGIRPCGCPAGTDVTVRELFGATPARFKFLKGSSAELSRVVDAVQRLALPNPGVGFTLRHDGKLVIEVPASDDVAERVAGFWGRETGDALRPVAHYEDDLAIEGLVAMPDVTRNNGSRVWIFVNGRFIQDRSLAAAVREAYREYLPPGRFPVGVLFLQMPVQGYDVNVHPQKTEVRFREPRRLFARIKQTIEKRLVQAAPPRISLRPWADRPSPDAGPVATPVPRTPSGRTADIHFPSTPVSAPPPAPSAPVHRDTTDPVEGATTAAREPEPGELGRIVAEHFARTATDRGFGPSKLPPAETARRVAAGPAAVESDRERPDGVPSPAGEVAAAAPHPLTTGEPVATPESGSGPAIDTALIRNLFQLRDSYLLAEYPDRMVLIDQHALHERVMFARFVARFRAGAIEKQRLLIPEPLDLTRAEAALLSPGDDDSIHQTLWRIGFEVELREQPVEGHPGRTERVAEMTAVPLLLARRLSPRGVRRTLQETLQEMVERPDRVAAHGSAAAELTDRDETSPETDTDADDGRIDFPAVARNVLATLACKASVRANESMTAEQAWALLEEAQALGSAYACPHGRPTTLELSFDRLDTWFGRSVR